MANEDRTPPDRLTWLDRLEHSPSEFDFFATLRRLECMERDRPRLGEAARPSDEGVRLGQEPSLAFHGAEITAASRREGGPIHITNAFFGLFGPHGPLPVHVTEYARDRARNASDNTLTAFADLFHHRLLLLFYRAWAAGQPTVQQDRPESNRFDFYLAALSGFGLQALRECSELYYAGRFVLPTRNAEGLCAIVGDRFGVPAAVEEFVGEWLDVPPPARWQLGGPEEASTLGQSTLLGRKVWQSDHRIRLVLGPLDREPFESFLPGGARLHTLGALVGAYLGDEYAWDVRLVLARAQDDRLRLGASARLGWTTKLGSNSRQDLVVDPVRRETYRIAKEAGGWRRIPNGSLALSGYDRGSTPTTTG